MLNIIEVIIHRVLSDNLEGDPVITRKFATQFSIKIHADTSLELDIVDNKGIIQCM